MSFSKAAKTGRCHVRSHFVISSASRTLKKSWAELAAIEELPRRTLDRAEDRPDLLQARAVLLHNMFLAVQLQREVADPASQSSTPLPTKRRSLTPDAPPAPSDRLCRTAGRRATVESHAPFSIV